MKTRTIQFVSRGKAELVETELDEKLSADEVLLKTICTLISPGTEFANLNGNNNWYPVNFPITLGYSAVATVLAVGTDVTNVTVGDRCLCYHSSHRNYQKRPSRDVVKIEYDDLAAEEAVYCVVGCMGFQGVRRCRPEFGESLMVMGLGLLGQFAILTARLSGCFPVIALDFNEKRRNIALASGADAAFSPDDPELESKIKALTNGKGADSVIEVTGNPQAVVQGLKLTAPFGRFSLVGCSGVPLKTSIFTTSSTVRASALSAHIIWPARSMTAAPVSGRCPKIWRLCSVLWQQDVSQADNFIP